MIHDVARSRDENDWRSLEDIRLVARIAALFHDLGKANAFFQFKLTQDGALADPVRHEWVSLRLFEAFVKHAKCDEDWLTRLRDLAGCSVDEIESGLVQQLLEHLSKDGIDARPANPFEALQHLPLACAVAWLIVSHHSLPTPDQANSNHGLEHLANEHRLNLILQQIDINWSGSKFKHSSVKPQELQDCWHFPKGLAFKSHHWRQHVSDLATALLKSPNLFRADADAFFRSTYRMHLARMILILGDHVYSNLPSQARYGDAVPEHAKVYANTRPAPQGGRRILNQSLDEHLIGVEVTASCIAEALPMLEQSLPRIARHQAFRARTTGRFEWQNAAFDVAQSLREHSFEAGFFGVNLASTGCGKTFANARILYGLADPQKGARFTVALGLRTLTLQTGDAYRERLGLAQRDLAVAVGGAGATAALHAHYQGQTAKKSPSGSESADDLLPGHTYVRYESKLVDGPLNRWLNPPSEAGSPHAERKRQGAAMLEAPVLVCTIDHLMPATEGVWGGHQILPMFRLMTSDLVLDEPDDFNVADLPALTRLVHWAGMLGSRLLLSSATLPPALVQGLFIAYSEGRAEFERNRGGRLSGSTSVCCAWFDEFGVMTGEHGLNQTAAGFIQQHERFVQQRVETLGNTQAVLRRAGLLSVKPVYEDLRVHFQESRKFNRRDETEVATQALAKMLLEPGGPLQRLHTQHHSVDPRTKKRVSFGLIRMANIGPLFELSRHLFQSLAPPGCVIHLCPYHARHPMLVRAEIEHQLDNVLKRHPPKAVETEAVFENSTVRAALDQGGELDHLFIVVATAVAEVGRDHDYDWAVIEPSSMRSMIQLSGRVQRHRHIACDLEHPNILILKANLRGVAAYAQRQKNAEHQPSFRWPGFENQSFQLSGYFIEQLLRPDQYEVIDARPRIQPRQNIDARVEPIDNLVDLEHIRLTDLLVQPVRSKLTQTPVSYWWATMGHLSGVLQRLSRFREESRPQSTYCFLIDDDGCQSFAELARDGSCVLQNSQIAILPDDELFTGTRVRAWIVPRYPDALQALAQALGLAVDDCAKRFGTVNLVSNKVGAVVKRREYHWVLGFQ